MHTDAFQAQTHCGVHAKAFFNDGLKVRQPLTIADFLVTRREAKFCGIELDAELVERGWVPEEMIHDRLLNSRRGVSTSRDLESRVSVAIMADLEFRWCQLLTFVKIYMAMLSSLTCWGYCCLASKKLLM